MVFILHHPQLLVYGEVKSWCNKKSDRVTHQTVQVRGRQIVPRRQNHEGLTATESLNYIWVLSLMWRRKGTMRSSVDRMTRPTKWFHPLCAGSRSTHQNWVVIGFFLQAQKIWAKEQPMGDSFQVRWYIACIDFGLFLAVVQGQRNAAPSPLERATKK